MTLTQSWKEKIEKTGTDTLFAPRNRLRIRNRPARKGLSVPVFSIFSQLLTLMLGAVLLWADASPKLVSLRIMPQERTLHGKQASQQFLVIGRFADNRERDLTSQAHFALSNSATARADESGRLFATADGATVLTASVAACTSMV